MLIENNILVGTEVRSNSEAQVFAHNLFVDSGFRYVPDTRRQSAYCKPHTLERVGRKGGSTAQDDKWFNNIFVRKGLDDVKKAQGYESDCNVFIESAKKSTFGDKNSVEDYFVSGFTIKDEPFGTTVTFNMNDTPLEMKAPRVDKNLVGVFPTVGQTIEDCYGNPITVDTDINGKKFTCPIPGPLSDLKEGQNTITWSYKKAE